MRASRALLLTLGALLAPVTTHSQPVIDGRLDAAFYGAPRSIQDTPTAYGNATLGHRRISTSGSELDVVYARALAGRLHLFIAGNLETGTQGLDWPGAIANRLEIFIDSKAGGQNRLLGNNADVDGDGLNRMGELSPDAGLTFDSGFEADYYFTFYNYTDVVPTPDPQHPNGEAWRGAMWYADMPALGGGTGTFLGIGSDPLPNVHIDEFTLAQDVRLGFDNSNVGGVTGTGDPMPGASDAANVTRGTEISIPYPMIAGAGPLSSPIKVALLINSRSHHFLSNQTLAPLTQPSEGYGNLGEPRVTNLAAILGAQFFTVPVEGPVAVETRGMPSDVDLAAPFPNPCRGTSRLSYTMTRGANARLALYDLHGRTVKTLVDGPVPSGAHHEEWDGRTNSGARVAPGVYVVRLDAVGLVRTQKLLVLEAQ